MLAVLLQLSAGYLVALIAGFRGALWFSAHALRMGAPWLAVIVIVLLTDRIEMYDGYNDPADPLAVFPRMVKWAWFAGLAAAVSHKARHLAIPILFGLHVAAVGYLVDLPEQLLYRSDADRLLWMGDRATILEAFLLQAWSGLGAPGSWPSEIATALLLPTLQWSLPAVLLLLVIWCHAVHTSGAMNVRPAVPPEPLALGPLPGLALAVTAAAAALSFLPGTIGVVTGDVARTVWLWHLLGTLKWMHGHARLRGWVLPAVVALPLIPTAMGATLGILGAAAGLWGIRSPIRPPAAWLKQLTGVALLISSALTWAVLQEVDIEVENPVDDRSTAHHISPHTVSAATWEAAERSCQESRGRICTLAEWTGRPNAAAGDFEWVALPTATGHVPGFAITVDIDGSPTTMSVAASLRDELSIVPSARCCH